MPRLVPSGALLVIKHLIPEDEGTRHQVLLRLRQVGIGTSPFYPSAMCEIAGTSRTWRQAISTGRKRRLFPGQPGV